jgi:benzodiazapine receptor
MGMAIMGLGGLLGLAALVCWVIVLIAAFKKDTKTGILSFILAPYALYFAFTKFEHQKKGLILAGWIGGFILCFVLQSVGGSMAAASAMQSVPQ